MRLQEFAPQQSQTKAPTLDPKDDPAFSDPVLMQAVSRYLDTNTINSLWTESPYNPRSGNQRWKDKYDSVVASVKPMLKDGNPDIPLVVKTIDKQIPIIGMPDWIKQPILQADAKYKQEWQKMGVKGTPEFDIIKERSKTEKQARFMAAAAHDPKFAQARGIKQSVAKEFNRADTGTKQLSNAMKHKPKKKPGFSENYISNHHMGMGTERPDDQRILEKSRTRKKPKERKLKDNIMMDIGQQRTGGNWGNSPT